MKEAAEAYEKKTTLNISDLENVPLNVQLEERIIRKGEPDEFTITVAIVGEEEYRVPKSVLGQVQALLADSRTKNMKAFSVLRTGKTKDDTRYQVVPRGV